MPDGKFAVADAQRRYADRLVSWLANGSRGVSNHGRPQRYLLHRVRNDKGPWSVSDQEPFARGLPRMASSKASMADCATTRRCSLRSAMSARLWRSGKTTTIPSGHTVRSAICRRRSMPRPALPECNGTGPCATLTAPRPVPLRRHRANRAQTKPGLFPSADETTAQLGPISACQTESADCVKEGSS